MSTMNHLTGYTARELLSINFGLRETVLEPWLRTEETAVIWSPSGVGKTFLSLSIALAVAGGGSLGDWTAPEARKVLYLDGEMHQGDLQDRINFLLSCGAVKVPDRELALSNLRIIARQAQEIGADYFDLTDPDHQEAIMGLVRGKADLLILDNLTTMSEGLTDENDAAPFKLLQSLFMELKRARVAAILVHHANKGGKQMRGSTALETTFEVILGLLKSSIPKPGSAAFVTEFTKFRGKGDTRLQARTWELGEGGWSILEYEPEDAKDDPVVKALRSLNYVTQDEIADAVGINKSTVSRRLKKAIAQGVLRDDEVNECLRKAKELREDSDVLDLEDW